MKALSMVGTLWVYWYRRGHIRLGRSEVLRALDMNLQNEPTLDTIDALLGAGELASQEGDISAAGDALRQGLDLSRALGDRSKAATLLARLGILEQYCEGQLSPARSHISEALELFQELGDRYWATRCLSALASIARQVGDFGQARSLLEDSLGRCNADEEPSLRVEVLHHLGWLAIDADDYEHAEAYLLEELALARNMHYANWEASSLMMLGIVASRMGDNTTAICRYRDSLTIQHEIGSPDGVAACLVNLVQELLEERDLIAARTYLPECLQSARKAAPWTASWALEAASRYLVSTQHEEQDCAPASKQLLLAAHLSAAAETVRREIGSPLSRNSLERMHKHLATLKRGLGDDAFDSAWDVGLGLELEEAIALAIGEVANAASVT
jgi:tetratricopeptide (TPR) repeat protein